MPGRQVIIADNEYYHVFNRGVARQPIFSSQRDYAQALLTLTYYLFSSPPMKLSRFKIFSISERDRIIAEQIKKKEVLVKLVAFTFMPNHVHFLFQQITNGGVAKFMSQFQNSYTRYFNTKQKRVGPLFQGAFKAVHVESEEQLLHLTRYIHLNPVISNVVKKEDLISYPWSSLQDYHKGSSSFVTLNPILDLLKTPDKYEKFVFDYMDYAERLHQVKHLLFEDP